MGFCIAAPRIITHIFASFIKQSHPSPYYWTTHGMFSIHVTKLTMNFSRFHVFRIQQTDYRLHFTCGGILYFLKHYKHPAQCVNAVKISADCVCALPQNQQTRHACAPSWPQRCSGNILKRNLLSGYPTYIYIYDRDWSHCLAWLILMVFCSNR